MGDSRLNHIIDSLASLANIQSAHNEIEKGNQTIISSSKEDNPST
jgi:hypothetical protein